jgi:peptidoglycan/xylan/chitin deacetylase (PgdA/CDA1 family)
VRAILTYHSIDPSGSVISMAEPVFRRQVEWLASGAVRVVGVGELLATAPEDDAVAVTFDDGFANFESAAWPLLREHGLPVTVFVVTDRVGKTNAWDGAMDHGIPEFPLLGWESLSRLSEEGVELGSHTRRHPPLCDLPPDRVGDEVVGSAEAIEKRTGRRPAGFAYPYGWADDSSRRAVAETYDWACTTELDWLRPGAEAHRLPRLDTYYYQSRGRLERWGSGAFRAHLRIRSGARRLRSRIVSGSAVHG